MEVESPIEGTLVAARRRAGPGASASANRWRSSDRRRRHARGPIRRRPNSCGRAEQPAADNRRRTNRRRSRPRRLRRRHRRDAGPAPPCPFARRRASQLHVDINAVAGSGPSGLITVSDVETAAAKTTTNGAAAAPTALGRSAAVADATAAWSTVGDDQVLGVRRNGHRAAQPHRQGRRDPRSPVPGRRSRTSPSTTTRTSPTSMRTGANSTSPPRPTGTGSPCSRSSSRLWCRR